MIKNDIFSKEFRIWDRVHISSGCWLWFGCKNKHGYGRYNGEYAHRVIYSEMVNPLTSNMEIDHICGNKSCVNPDHLRECTHAENTRNRPKVSKCNTSGFRGIYKVNNKWRSDFYLDGVKTYIGIFDTPLEAHLAWREIARIVYGKFANLD